MQSRITKSDGFSLVELMVVVAIIAVLVTIAYATYGYTTVRTRRLTCELNRRHFDTSVSVYENDHDAKPTSIDDLTEYITNFDVAKVCPGDNTTELRYDVGLDRVVCDFHE